LPRKGLYDGARNIEEASRIRENKRVFCPVENESYSCITYGLKEGGKNFRTARCEGEHDLLRGLHERERWGEGSLNALTSVWDTMPSREVHLDR